MDERPEGPERPAERDGDAPQPEGAQPLEEFYGRDDIFGFKPATVPLPRPPAKKARTATGAPLLAGDPHRAIDLPNVYWQNHLTCPEFDVIGLSFAGVPQPNVWLSSVLVAPIDGANALSVARP